MAEEEKQRNEVSQTVFSIETDLFEAYRDSTGTVYFWMRMKKSISKGEMLNLRAAIILQHEELVKTLEVNIEPGFSTYKPSTGEASI